VFPRLTFATLPTPLHPLQRLSVELGFDVWMKRDDLTGFGMGGNKVRKAEFLLADAKEQGADVVLTAGPVQSNHARVIAAAARALGLECHLFLAGQTTSPPTGNLFLDHLAGAELHVVSSSGERAPAMEAFAEKIRAEGRRPYVIPVGGSNAVGAQGYAVAFQELRDQVGQLPPKSTRVVFASSSGGTHAGLLVGREVTRSKMSILGVRVDFDPSLEETICTVANDCARRLGLVRYFQTQEVHLAVGYVGKGYGVPSEEGSEAMRKLWQSEGILLDPVYTAKAMAGLIDLGRRGEFENERVIFIHTGGIPAVFSSVMTTPS